LAHIAVSKFAGAEPLYVKQKIFNRLYIELSHAVMSQWMVKAERRCAGLLNLLQNGL
jgi:hypothetical protein